MRELINPDVPRTWRKRTGGQLNDGEGGPCADYRACCSRHPKVKQGMGVTCNGPGRLLFELLQMPWILTQLALSQLQVGKLKWFHLHFIPVSTPYALIGLHAHPGVEPVNYYSLIDGG